MSSLSLATIRKIILLGFHILISYFKKTGTEFDVCRVLRFSPRNNIILLTQKVIRER